LHQRLGPLNEGLRRALLEPTNNHAGRGLRGAAMLRKFSCGMPADTRASTAASRRTAKAAFCPAGFRIDRPSA
jgi:hypothetical protein